tara:strand:- start:301 stop:537 length:237 start_codon:yes stop_codon:yes gene_type:complete
MDESHERRFKEERKEEVKYFKGEVLLRKKDVSFEMMLPSKINLEIKNKEVCSELFPTSLFFVCSLILVVLKRRFNLIK